MKRLYDWLLDKFADLICWVGFSLILLLAILVSKLTTRTELYEGND